jgi:3-deoxy-D-manno-octulosonate 8-phosphate phosphatase (KDO 8-P phosphatase)
MEEIERLYTDLGGRFITPATEVREKLRGIRAFVLDWDGVFNNGQKTSTTGSSFSEVDSMGLNLLRFSHFIAQGAMPATLIISGEKNESAFHYCEREGLTYSFFKIPHKIMALDFLCAQEKLQAKEIAYFFDDVLDLPVAEKCGLRIQINQRMNPLFIEYCVKNKLVDYLTAASGGKFALREAAEMLTGLNGNFEEVIKGRINNSEVYQEYISQRKKVRTRFFTLKEGEIGSVERPA